MFRKFSYRSLGCIFVFGTIIMGGKVVLSGQQEQPIVSEEDGRCVIVDCASMPGVPIDPLNSPASHPCFEFGGGDCYFPPTTPGNLVFCKKPTTIPYAICSFNLSPPMFNNCTGVCATDTNIPCEVYNLLKCQSPTAGAP